MGDEFLDFYEENFKNEEEKEKIITEYFGRVSIKKDH